MSRAHRMTEQISTAEDLQMRSDGQLVFEYSLMLSTYAYRTATEYQRLSSKVERMLEVPYMGDAWWSVATVRAYLHELATEMRRRGLTFDEPALRVQDKKWQEWVAQCLAESEAASHPTFLPRDAPKSEWWLWPDEVGRLSDEQLNTL